MLICGSRSWTDAGAVVRRVGELPDGTLVICGGARGVDELAAEAAWQRGLFACEVPVRAPLWERYGRRAGPLRNHAMLDLQPQLVIAFQRDRSPGTQSTIDEARRRGIPVECHAA